MNELCLLDSLFNEVLEAAPGFIYRGGVSAPKVDVSEDENAYTLEMELPGRSEKDVNIELDRDNLTISSREVKEAKEDKKDRKSAKYLLRERGGSGFSSFSRSFALPEDVNQEDISASFENGILTVSMKKKPVIAPKKIAITVGRAS